MSMRTLLQTTTAAAKNATGTSRFERNISQFFGLSTDGALILFMFLIFLTGGILVFTYVCSYKLGAYNKERELRTRGYGRVRRRNRGRRDSEESLLNSESSDREGTLLMTHTLEGANVQNDMAMNRKGPKAVVVEPKAGKGRYFADYQVFKEIGVGSYGTVWLVKKDSEDVYYALKTLDCANERAIATARREINLLSSLTHPNIVGYREFFTLEPTAEGIQTICIVMEFCKYGGLPDIIKNKTTPLSEEGVMVWFAKLVDALGYIHTRDIIHRDLKPDNIFVGEKYDLKIGDFGVATELSINHTQTTTTAGTPVYMAPEVLQNQSYNTVADVWSLGVILYRIVSLKRLKTIICLDVASGRLAEMLDDIHPNYSPDITYFVRNLLEIEPSRRPTIQQLKADPIFLAWEAILFFEDKRFMTDNKSFPAAVISALAKFLDEDDRPNIRPSTRHNAFSVLAHLLSTSIHVEARAKALFKANGIGTLVNYVTHLEPNLQPAGLNVVLAALTHHPPNVHLFISKASAGIECMEEFLLEGADYRANLCALSIIKLTLQVDLPSVVHDTQARLRDLGMLDLIAVLVSSRKKLVAYEAARVMYYAIDNVSREIALAGQASACTFMLTRHEPYRQRLYVCRTCTSVLAKNAPAGVEKRDMLVCSACADVCHRSHELLPRAGAPAACRCGANETTVECDCLHSLGETPVAIHLENQALPFVGDSVIPAVLKRLSDNPDVGSLAIFFRLLFAACYDNKDNSKSLHNNKGIELVSNLCIPRSADHPEATIYGLTALTAAVDNNAAAIKTFGRRRCQLLLGVLLDNSDPALTIAALQLLEAVIYSGSKANLQRMIEAGVVQSLQRTVDECSLTQFCSDYLLAQLLGLSRSTVRIAPAIYGGSSAGSDAESDGGATTPARSSRRRSSSMSSNAHSSTEESSSFRSPSVRRRRTRGVSISNTDSGSGSGSGNYEAGVREDAALHGSSSSSSVGPVQMPNGVKGKAPFEPSTKSDSDTTTSSSYSSS